jgi:two-component system sensor histidine kinase GlrK
MVKLLPQSFHRLVLIGFVLVALPLLLAVFAVFSLLDGMVFSRQEALSQAMVAARAGREIEATLGSMKQSVMRLPQQSRPDMQALPAYLRLHEQFTRQFEYFGALPATVGQKPAIGRVLDRARILRDDFSARSDASLLAGQIFQIDAETRAILQAGGQALEREIEWMGREAAKLRLILIAAIVSACVVAVAMLLVLRTVVSERIRQMDRAIRDIGRTDFVPDIMVVGTPDFSDLGRRLDWLRRRLRNTEAQRTRFLRHVSHDLKTPLTAICEGAQLLSEGAAGPLDPRQRPLVDIVGKNAQRLQKFIEDFLNYQQISSARVSLELRAIRMAQLCETVLSAHIMAVGKHNVRVKRNLSEVELNGDWNKLYAVLDNLISNAIKFSPEDGVVTVSLAEEGGEVVVDVMDQGNGVPEEERKRIFEPFFRGTRAQKGTIKGSGLGLAIARDYARAHRGRLELIDSQQGAHFRLTLPKRQGNNRVG